MNDLLDQWRFRSAVGRFASSVAVVAAATDEGFRALTVSSFTVVSWDPPLVLVCVDCFFRAHDALVAAQHFAVSLLSDRQEFLAERFAGRAPGASGRFESVAHDVAPSGAPVLRGAVAWIDCRRFAVHDAGDHTLLLGEALAVGESGGDPLLYHGGRYAHLRD